MMLERAIAEIRARENATWDMARVYLDNRDAHGIMDMGAELQALERARKEIEKLSV